MAEDTQPDALLTPAEVAALFRVNPKTVTRWARAGKITAIRTLGGHRRFRASEIRRCLEQLDSSNAVAGPGAQRHADRQLPRRLRPGMICGCLPWPCPPGSSPTPATPACATRATTSPSSCRPGRAPAPGCSPRAASRGRASP